MALIAALAVAFGLVVSTARAAMTGTREPSTVAATGDAPDDASPPTDSTSDSTSDSLSDPLSDDEFVADGDDVSTSDELADTSVPTDDTVEFTGPIEGRVLAVGGSSLAGLNWNPPSKKALQGAEFTLDLESCRRLYKTSCSALRSSPPATAYEVVKRKGRGHHTMILMGGYNDSGSRFKEGFEKVVEAAREVGIVRIVWATYRLPADYEPPDDPLTSKNYKANNEILKDLLATGDYPEVVLADWNTYSADQDYWFSDNVHFSALGAWGAADYLSRKIAYLDKRACPQPRRPIEKPQNPCPDPDRKPPDVDYAAVYNFKSGRLVCYDVTTKPEHIECKPPKEVDKETLEGVVLDTLEYGDEGPQVETLQTALRELKLYKGTPSKEFDEDTLIALMRFQQRNELPVTGNAGPRTRQLLGFGCPEAKRNDEGECPLDEGDVVFPWELERDSRGIRVWVLQDRLHELGYLAGEPNSYFGTKTKAAVKKFQAEEGLDETGIVDVKTVKALGFEVP